MPRAILPLALALCLGGCRAEVIEYCVAEPSACPPCLDDDDCLFLGNSCNETVLCAAAGTDVAFTMIGCSEALEHDWPDDEECRCREGVCYWTGAW